ncbi:hypothetical protein Psuf_061720 [Phytohabitans suffuscus]|uniref:Uncharacterized protein n=1 Tax=Phytohabitans suffuscus TaxID=624315 RepID=A0A6F8YS22_9ACTN|nr:hypothetical protein [Phytohabitans suffuscus]BCB88859.1 hypothetical protein Psuf_061720 [Phytohabitans suffuscus]
MPGRQVARLAVGAVGRAPRFARYGARSIMLARFVPVVRTFTPIVAGASNMP